MTINTGPSIDSFEFITTVQHWRSTKKSIRSALYQPIRLSLPPHERRSPVSTSVPLQLFSERGPLGVFEDPQTAWDQFYSIFINALNINSSLRSVAIISADPNYVTPHILSLLRRKNRLMRAEITDEASPCIKSKIKTHAVMHLRDIGASTQTRELRRRVNEPTPRGGGNGKPNLMPLS